MNLDGSMARQGPGAWRVSWAAALVLLLGFMIRLYAFYHMPVINPDGTIYIQQARGISDGDIQSVLSCSPMVSVYPFFILLAQRVFGDWVTAARVVSLLSGTLTLVLCYLLARRFFGELISCLWVSILAFNPTLVSVGVDAMRDPLYWFFSCLGLYLFVLQIEGGRARYGFSASLSFILCAWARVEGILYLLVSGLYLIFKRQEDRRRQWGAFFLPVVCLGLFGVLLVGPIRSRMGYGFGFGFVVRQIADRVTGVFDSYQALQSGLKHLSDQTPAGISPYFFPKVRDLAWFIALGALCMQIVRGFFPPFFLPFILGIKDAKGRISKDPRVAYLFFMAACAFVALYVQTLYNWAMVSRFIAIFMFPSLIFTGLGFGRLIGYLDRRLRWRPMRVGLCLGILVLAIGIPKNLGSHREDKIILKEVGEYLAGTQKGEGEIRLAGAFKRVNVVYFYANLNSPRASCMDPSARLIPHQRASLRRLETHRFDYLVWDEKSWSPADLQWLRRKYGDRLSLIKEWESPYLGRVLLFRVR